MNSPLQSTDLTADELATSPQTDEEIERTGEEGHIHLPNPSFWPILLTVALVLAVGGLITWTNGNLPWLSIIAIPLVLIGIIGWGLEDPMAKPKEEAAERIEIPKTYAEAVAEGRLTPYAEALLREAQEAVDRTVTIANIPWSAHPVSVEVEQEGVVLSLYGKVELETQKQAIEDALLKLPGVIDVKNFIVAEEEILNAANARIESLRAAGKLEGAKDLGVQVENYIVSLYGEVPNREMKYMLENELLSIPKVRVVINHIGLNKDIPGNLGKTRNKVGK